MIESIDIFADIPSATIKVGGDFPFSYDVSIYSLITQTNEFYIYRIDKVIIKPRNLLRTLGPGALYG